jgi:hypothetical protein
MKTFSADALAALQRGDAIVSASVEIIPSAGTEGAGSTFAEDFSDGLAGFSLYTGFNSGFSVVSDDYGNCLLCDPGSGGGRNEIVEPVGGSAFSEITFKFKVTASGVDDYGMLDLLDADGNLIFGFMPARQANIDALRRPNVVFFDQSGQPGNPIGAGAVTLNHWYEVDALYDGSSSFDVTVTDLTTSTVFGSVTIAVTARSPIAKLGFATENFFGSGSVRWDDIQIVLDDPVAAPPIRLWGGYGTAALPSDEGTSFFSGIGDRGLIASSTGAIGGTAQNLTLALSGIEPAALEVLNPDEVRDASVVVRRLIFDSAGKTLLGAYVFCRGRLDELKTSEMVGGAAAIQLSVEGAARGLGRRGGRARSDADQRLVSSTDGFYRVVSAAPKKTLYWGGKTPSIGSSLSGGGVAVSTSSSSILGVAR